MKAAKTRAVQHFSDEYLDQCRKLRPEEVAEFLENFRLIHGGEPTTSRLISMKVPQTLLDAFRRKCRLEGLPYQTQIKRLMSDWLGAMRRA